MQNLFWQIEQKVFEYVYLHGGRLSKGVIQKQRGQILVTTK